MRAIQEVLMGNVSAYLLLLQSWALQVHSWTPVNILAQTEVLLNRECQSPKESS